MIRHTIPTLGLALLLQTAVCGGLVGSPVFQLALAADSPVRAAAHRYKIVVDGLACPFCAYGIEKQLHRISGVRDVQTDIASETVSVTMAPGSTLGKDTAAQAVKEAGFTLHEFQEAPPVPQ